MKAPIVEIFSSFQGEGLWIGRRQIFVRFAGCNLSCDYCDTANSQSTDSGILMSVDEVFEKIKELKTPDLHSISFTGGEPLLYADFINKISNKISNNLSNKEFNKESNKEYNKINNKIDNNLSNRINDKNDIKIMIETNGTLPESINKIDKIDCVSLDIKLKEHLGKNWKDEIFENELSSIKLLIGLNKMVYCKLVVFPSTDISTISKIGKKLADILNCCSDIGTDSNNKNRYDVKIPIVIQPASPVEQWKNKTDLLFTFSESMGQYMDVLTIPQTHKFLNIE